MISGATPIERYKDFVYQQKCMSIRQLIQLRKQYITGIPKWRLPLWGYVCALPVILIAFFLLVFFHRFIYPLLFPTVFLTLALALISFLWGVGPALLMLVISLVGLDFYFIPPVGQLTLLNWESITQWFPFLITNLIIVLITGQRERAYINGYQSLQQLHQYAEELETATSYLEETKRERDSFLLVASHELKNPVTSIRGQLQLLRRHLAKKPTAIDAHDLEETLQRIHDQSIRLTTLIDQLLDINIFRSHETVLSKSRYDLNQLCQKVIEDQLALTGRVIVFSPSVEPLELQIDVDRMIQVVLNLVGNALKYSSRDKPVEVRVSRNNQRALLQVQDHGLGITPEELPHIFGMYYRTPRARSSTTSGLGLGLAISKDIVDRHGGHIWCTSELNRGSTFFVELPCQNEELV